MGKRSSKAGFSFFVEKISQLRSRVISDFVNVQVIDSAPTILPEPVNCISDFVNDCCANETLVFLAENPLRVEVDKNQPASGNHALKIDCVLTTEYQFHCVFKERFKFGELKMRTPGHKTSES